MKKKTIALVLACILCVAIGIGGTLAWLTATSDDVVNTFTTSDIDITLAETKGGDSKEFKMVPGWTIDKDPKVTVATGSEDCYLFVKLEKSSNFDTFLTYTMADGWKQLKDEDNKDVSGVFYRVIGASEMGTAISVLANDQVTVKETVTKADMNGLTATTYPTLTVTAYATQLWKDNNPGTDATEAEIAAAQFTAIGAWAKVAPASPTT